MTEAQHNVIWNALMTSESLIDDLIGLDNAGLETGFKRKAVLKMKSENAAALAALAMVKDKGTW